MRHDLQPYAHLIEASTSFNPVERPNLTQIKGSITFRDLSILYIRETYVADSGWIDYSYHWQAANNELIHRWDNAHPVSVDTSPHHQHVGSEENIQPSEPITLEKVLSFIASRLNH